MSLEVVPIRTSGRGPSGRTAAAAVLLTIGLVVSVGVLGGGRGPAGPASSAAAAGVVPDSAPPAAPSPGDQPAAVTPLPRSIPSSNPGYAHELWARQGVPAVTRGAVTPLDEPPALVASGLETVSASAASATGRVVADGLGIVWAYGSGGLVRWDPATGRSSAWGADDDLRFVAWDIVAARRGGVWLVADRTVRRFDGTAFREAFDVGEAISAATEAPDGTVWVATQNHAVIPLTDPPSRRIDGLAPDGDSWIWPLAVDTAGNVWCGWTRSESASGSWVARYDGRAWRVFDAADSDVLGGAVRAITALPDGTAWVATDRGVVGYDGTSWSDAPGRSDARASGPPASAPDAVAAGWDGAYWIAASDQLARFDGTGWTTAASLLSLGAPAHLPSSIAPVAGGVVAAVEGVLWRLSASGWEPILAAQAQGPSSPFRLVAVSYDEAWSSEDTHAWHYKRGVWTAGPPAPQEANYLRDLARTPSGSVWATFDGAGAFVLRDGYWEGVGFEGAEGLAVDAAGTVWVTGDETEGGWDARAYRLVAGRWTPTRELPRTNLAMWPTHLAVAADGTIFVGTIGSWGIKPGLARYVDGKWRLVVPTGLAERILVTAVAVASNGDLWVAGAPAQTGPAPVDGWVARLHGDRWTVFRPGGRGSSTSQGTGWIDGLAISGDGTVWVASSTGLYRYDGRAWTSRLSGAWFSAVSVARDGTVWVIGPSGVARLAGTTATR